MPHGDITHVDIPADDVERARGFYTAVFGWQIDEVPGYEGYPMWRAPNQVSGGGITQRNDTISTMRSYVEVDSIDAVLAAVREAGGTVVMERSPISDTSWYAVFIDTEGNEIGLYEGETSTGADSDADAT